MGDGSCMRDVPYIVMTDMGADLPHTSIAQLGIQIAPMHYQLRGEACSIEPGKQADLTAFYYALRNGVPANTIPVLPEAFSALWEPVLAAGTDVLQLIISRAISNTMNAAIAARSAILPQYPGRRVVLVDTASCSMAQGMLVFEAAKMREEGSSLDEAAEWVVQNSRHLNVLLLPQMMDWLRNGGAFTGNLPVSALFSKRQLFRLDENGRLQVQDHARDEREAIGKMAAVVRRTGYALNTQVISVTHADAPELAATLVKALKDEAGCGDVLVLPMGPIIGCHAGPGAVGVAFFGSIRTS